MISNTQLLIHNIATMSQLLIIDNLTIVIIDNLTKLHCANKSISDFSRCHNATIYIATMQFTFQLSNCHILCLAGPLLLVSWCLQ